MYVRTENLKKAGRDPRTARRRGPRSATFPRVLLVGGSPTRAPRRCAPACSPPASRPRAGRVGTHPGLGVTRRHPPHWLAAHVGARARGAIDVARPEGHADIAREGRDGVDSANERLLRANRPSLAMPACPSGRATSIAPRVRAPTCAVSRCGGWRRVTPRPGMCARPACPVRPFRGDLLWVVVFLFNLP